MRSARRFRCHEEDGLRDLYSIRHDQKLYMNTAKQRVHDLERLLIAELKGEGPERDAGWDTDSLRRDFGSKPDGVAGPEEASAAS